MPYTYGKFFYLHKECNEIIIHHVKSVRVFYYWKLYRFLSNFKENSIIYIFSKTKLSQTYSFYLTETRFYIWIQKYIPIIALFSYLIFAVDFFSRWLNIEFFNNILDPVFFEFIFPLLQKTWKSKWKVLLLLNFSFQISLYFFYQEYWLRKYALIIKNTILQERRNTE